MTTLTITSDIVVHEHLGFGFQGDVGLNLERSAAHGLDEAGRELVRRRIRAMRPSFVRLATSVRWFRFDAAGPNTYDHEEFRDLVEELRLYQEVGARVLLTDWGPSPDWADCLCGNPHPRHHRAIAEAWAEMVSYLHEECGLHCVCYVMLYNEPSHMRVLAEVYENLVRELRTALRERDLLNVVQVMGPDTTNQNGQSFFEHATWAHGEVFDCFDVHVYNTETGAAMARCLQPYLDRIDRLDGYIAGQETPEIFADLVARAHAEGHGDFGTQGRRPLLLTEFGYGNEHAYSCSQNDTYAYGLNLADIAVHTSQAGIAAALMWTVMDGYMFRTAQFRGKEIYMRWGLWHWADEGWEPRPGFYAWSLLTRHVDAGMRVQRVAGNTDELAASAFLGPDGACTLLLVNRHDHAQRVELAGLPAGGCFDLHCYEAAAVPTPDREPLPATARPSSDADGRLWIDLPAASFTCLHT